MDMNNSVVIAGGRGILGGYMSMEKYNKFLKKYWLITLYLPSTVLGAKEVMMKKKKESEGTILAIMKK